MSKVGVDTDGTKWMTVRYTLDVQVIAEDVQEALHQAFLALPDHSLEEAEPEVIAVWS
jgi:hypothetical protein